MQCRTGGDWSSDVCSSDLELHPVVLKNWGIEMPVAAFEIELSALK
jgi:hypothetical protein